MKKIVLSLAILSLLAVTTSAQHVLTYDNNAYLNADEQPFIITDSVREGNPGPDQVWDFSKLNKTGELTSYMFAAKNFEKSSLYPEANIVLRENKTDFYFKVSASGMEEYGNSNEYSSVVYDSPIVKFPFPFTYGSSCAGAYSGQAIANNQSRVISGTYTTLADGYGTLILPGDVKIQNVLRVRFMRKQDNNPAETITYRWYAQNSDPIVRYPLLSITFYKKGEHTKAHIAAYYANAYQLSQNQENSEQTTIAAEYTSPDASIYNIKTSPNPFTEKALIEYTIPEDARVNIQVFDNLGRLIEKLTDTQQAAGNYSVSFKGTGQFIYFIRFIVNDKLICSKKIIQMK
ncbi:MAG TPA: T9SS type A sorting domain-containing protein [Bacteroidales bacterium]|nr:T9SS type A sorting domain-containing protein [Bacteroidales bacterium]